ncbi:BnaCnng32120D [Brassica napus]|uniref:BnaCnng32120D protein n=1 Tax=Brassica napus TaxID=3708 RepID=A0A078J4C2_BRANA|nr:BnaCnng32120D [Brassica napus]
MKTGEHKTSRRLGSSPEIAYLVNEEVLTKAETMTIREMFAYIKQESAKYLAKISVYDNNDQSSPFLVMHDVSRLGSMPQN